jgi:hypothetical protein
MKDDLKKELGEFFWKKFLCDRAIRDSYREKVSYRPE